MNRAARAARAARAVAVIVVLIPSVLRAQSGLTYDFSLAEKLDGRTMSSTGHATVAGNNVRIDLVGPSSLSRVGALSLGDSISLISTETGIAQVLSLIGQKSKEYIQFQPLEVVAKMREAMRMMPEVAEMVFTGEVTLDSLGPGDVIAGYNTLHYRLTISVQVSGRGRSGQTIVNNSVGDYYIALDLKEFSAGTAPWNGAEQAGIQFGSFPIIPQSFLSKLDAAAYRLDTGLLLRQEVVGHVSIRGAIKQTLEVSNIKRADVPTATFEIPAGYKKIDLPEMAGVMR